VPIPNWFVNGQRIVNPPGGAKLCELNPPFTQHMTIEVLVHCALSQSEIRHRGADQGTKQIILCANRDDVYMTVEPGDWLELFLVELGAGNYVQGSLYVWR
jgi:hypothetical protein